MGRDYRRKFYMYRIADKVFTIYVFTIHARWYVYKPIHAGLAWDKHGDYSKQLKRLMKKYSLTRQHLDTSDTEAEMIHGMYVCNEVYKKIIAEHGVWDDTVVPIEDSSYWYCPLHPKFEPYFKDMYKVAQRKRERKELPKLL